MFVRLQDGHFVSATGLDSFTTWCDFELKDRNMQEFIIQPGDFIIRKTRVSETTVLTQLPVILASGDGIPTFLRHDTEMFLGSEQQPQVYLLKCSYLTGQPAVDTPVNVIRIRQALGEYVSFKRPAAAK
ncbi:MAG: hypothetical protein KZQ58_06585 [gamma proteobacterium symbiont of Bathyaustriella thionipta]|nr:hypothetical protein [gamma proteobacterium symbiont of Bathyaustriella thionipta]